MIDKSLNGNSIKRSKSVLNMMLSQQMQRVSRRVFRGKLRSFSASAADTTSGARTMDDQKRELAQAALKQVPQHGWTQDAITAAVLEHPNMTISMAGLFTPSELVHWLMDDFNRQLREDPVMSKEWSVVEKIKWRLEQVAPLAQSGQWHKGMALGLTTPLVTRCQLHEFIELVSPPGSSMMYQTTLGGIFLASELHLLTDSSPGYEQTWSFLEARIEELDKGDFVNLSGAAASLPLAATSAVAFSLFEGLSSMILPSSMYGVPGASPSDYTVKGTHK